MQFISKVIKNILNLIWIHSWIIGNVWDYAWIFPYIEKYVKNIIIKHTYVYCYINKSTFDNISFLQKKMRFFKIRESFVWKARGRKRLRKNARFSHFFLPPRLNEMHENTARNQALYIKPPAGGFEFIFDMFPLLCVVETERCPPGALMVRERNGKSPKTNYDLHQRVR